MLRLDHAPAWIAASLLLVALVVWGSLVPGPAAPPVDHFDKFQHAAVYGLLALWFTGLAARRHYVTVAAALIALGVLMEVLQQAMHLGRQADVLDVAANVCGTAVGVALGAWHTGGWAPRVEAWLAQN